MEINKEHIKQALLHVRYPGSGQDIVNSGMLQQDTIKIESNKVEFTIVFDKPNDPFAKSVLKASEKAIQTYVSEGLEAEATPFFKEQPKPTVPKILPEVKNIIAVFSAKGGVGKSTVSANLAISLAKQGYKVGLLDADIHGPSIPKMFGVENETPFAEEQDGVQKVIPIEKYGIKLLSIGFFIDKEKALIWRGSMASNALQQLITDADWGHLDYFIMDLPPGTGDIHLTLVQTLGITGVVVVTTPQQVALADARKGINMFIEEKINVPILGLVENMAWFTPKELPNNKYYIFGKEGGKQFAEEFDVPLLGQIPIVQSICESGDNGTPFAMNDNQMTTLCFKEVASNVIKEVETRNNKLPKTEKVKIVK